MTSVVRSKDKQDEKVWKLRLAGGGPDLEVAKKHITSNITPAQQKAAEVASAKKGPACDIESSLQLRIKEGAINSVVREAK